MATNLSYTATQIDDSLKQLRDTTTDLNVDSGTFVGK